jgi:peptidyl-prolyl cis-trans isomerase C
MTALTSTRILTVVAACAAFSAVACNRNRDKGGQPSSSGPEAQPVARVDDTIITVGDLQDRINKQSGFPRGRYTSIERRKELLDSLIRIEVIAKEAERRGYDQDPEVIRVRKQQMISRFLQRDFESKLRVEDVPDADVAKYYSEHPEEFNRPEDVRVSEILVQDKPKAERVAALARAADRNDAKAFRDLVTKYSEDEDSKPRGGDLTAFDRAATTVPRPIVDAAFALNAVGDISPPVKTDKGYTILRLTMKRPGLSRPLPEVKRQIQQRLFRDLRTKALDAFIADLRKKYTVTIDEANLAKVSIDTGMDSRAGSPLGANPMPGHAVGAVPGPSPGLHPVAPAGHPAAERKTP